MPCHTNGRQFLKGSLVAGWGVAIKKYFDMSKAKPSLFLSLINAQRRIHERLVIFVSVQQQYLYISSL